MTKRNGWFTIRKPLAPRRSGLLKLCAFVLPLAIWATIAYVPFEWKPLITIESPGDAAVFSPGQVMKKSIFQQQNVLLNEQGKVLASGHPTNPIYLPKPHEVATALVTAFSRPPIRKGDPWLHESLMHSAQIIFWGFLLSCLIGVPLGILCGTFDFFAKLIEPFVDFVRYMPAPAFAALVVAVLGIYDAPKIAIIFIGTFFQMVLVVSNTTRDVQMPVIEAAQTLGASNKQVLYKIVIPAILPNLYDNLRILLGWAWTYLIVAEMVGAASGISYFINQQGRYSRYDNVYAGIIIIGLVGLVTDQLLSRLKPYLMPWVPGGKPTMRNLFGRRDAPARPVSDPRAVSK